MKFKIVVILFLTVASWTLNSCGEDENESPEPVWEVGKIGPAKGWIFFDKGSYSDGWRYLEAAPADLSQGIVPWGCDLSTIAGADGFTIGTGFQNTIDIESGCSEAGTAADLCAHLSLNGFDDWFMPSKDELNLMFTELKSNNIGDFSTYHYWSSTEDTNHYAWIQNFTIGGQGVQAKFGLIAVRPVRFF